MHRRRRRSRFWHDPERLPGQADRDAALGRTHFFVYVLATTRGHYVGHTWHVATRLRAHVSGQVPSTAGASPRLLWTSRPFATRADAARFEASLKSLRDQRSPRYSGVVGLDPEPFVRPALGPRFPRPVHLLIVLAVFVDLVILAGFCL